MDRIADCVYIGVWYDTVGRTLCVLSMNYWWEVAVSGVIVCP